MHKQHLKPRNCKSYEEKEQVYTIFLMQQETFTLLKAPSNPN